MKARVGLWIDHRKAIIVSVTSKGQEMGLVLSRMEERLQRAGGSDLTGRNNSRRTPADNARQRVATGHLNTYYDAVIACLRDAEEILIFGPGEAKSELKKRLKKHDMGERIAGIETVDRMTERQIAAKVREHFSK
jgi:hypothetical protein